MPFSDWLRSLRSKRFREVREQIKSEKRDFRCFARAKNGARAKKRKEGWGRKEVSFVPLPRPPRSFFGSRPIFRAGKIPKIPFLGLSLLPNPTETLATQANWLRYSLSTLL